jgi:uncharacterized protein YndB with AHSA1/START domain
VTAPQLRIERVLPATPERVFEAWVSPGLLRRWWAAAPGWRGADAEVDLRPGGRYRLAMEDPEAGAVHAVGGEFLEVDPPRRLVYSWTWEGDPPEMEGSAGSEVTVEFHPTDGGTLLVLVHRGLASDVITERHAHGWAGCLANLEARVLAPGAAA